MGAQERSELLARFGSERRVLSAGSTRVGVEDPEEPFDLRFVVDVDDVDRRTLRRLHGRYSFRSGELG